ncbi:protein of unknown function [Methylorubrum extorquens]|uniref:Uncharacterized protein n=1 Tax=Methylorubrum extorquens TaxID=408 RepID=A0A2N9AVN9_METEX|nr:protein of unknown function [Methylorubrum extorquens]
MFGCAPSADLNSHVAAGPLLMQARRAGERVCNTLPPYGCYRRPLSQPGGSIGEALQVGRRPEGLIRQGEERSS